VDAAGTEIEIAEAVIETEASAAAASPTATDRSAPSVLRTVATARNELSDRNAPSAPSARTDPNVPSDRTDRNEADAKTKPCPTCRTTSRPASAMTK
jgi:hypothetical protein